MSVLTDEENVWNKFIIDLFTNVDRDILKTAFENIVINGTLKQSVIHDKLTAEYDCNIPWAILMDPTSACNLQRDLKNPLIVAVERAPTRR